jgi:hypothetical protein
MKAEVGRGVVGAERQLMLKSDKLEFERGLAAKAENQHRYKGKENRHHERDGTAGSRKSPASLSPVEILSKDRAIKGRNHKALAIKSNGRDFCDIQPRSRVTPGGVTSPST